MTKPSHTLNKTEGWQLSGPADLFVFGLDNWKCTCSGVTVSLSKVLEKIWKQTEPGKDPGSSLVKTIQK